MDRIDESVWTVEAPLSVFGVELGARMTVVRCDDDRLWVHSPIELDDPLRSTIDELGEVAFVVAPNRLHHLFAGDWTEAYPEAELWGAPGLPEKRDDLDFDGVLTRDPHPWGDAIDEQPIEGTKALGEIVFYHRPSRTLVGADLFFNCHEAESTWTRLYLWMSGVLGKPAISSLMALDFRDEEAVRESYEALFDWDFQRIVISHGRIVDERARETLREVVDDTFD